MAYIESIIIALTHLMHISELLSVSLNMSNKIFDKYYSEFPEYNYRQENTNNEDNVANVLTAIFLNIYPITYIGNASSLSPNAEIQFKEKVRKHSSAETLVAICKSIISQIHQLTFALRAKDVMDAKNEQIKKLNKENGYRIPKLTQTYFATKANLNKETVNNYFIGKQLPSTDFLLLFSKETDTPIEYLLNPKVPVSELTYKLRFNAAYEHEFTQLGGETGYILRFLFDRWANLNPATTDQARLINMTLNYLIRDLFVDDTGCALIPTLNKASILNQRSNQKDQDNMKYTLTSADRYYKHLVETYRQGALRLNKESVLFLIGRYMFDSEFSVPYINETNLRNRMIVNSEDIMRLRRLSSDQNKNFGEIKNAMTGLLNGMERLDDVDVNLEFSENISDYYLGKIIVMIENSLKKQCKNTTTPTATVYRNLPNKSKHKKKPISDELKKGIITENLTLKEINDFLDMEIYMDDKEREQRRKEFYRNSYKFLKEANLKEIYLNDEAVFLPSFTRQSDHGYEESMVNYYDIQNGIILSNGDSEDKDQRKPRKTDEEKLAMLKSMASLEQLSEIVVVDDIAIPKSLIKQMYYTYRQNDNKLIPDNYDLRKHKVREKYSDGFNTDYAAMSYELDRIDAERDGRLKEFEKQNAKRKEAINKRFKEKTSALPTPDSEGETEEDDIN